MKTLKKIFEDFHISKISLKSGILDAEIVIVEADKIAAWEMYVELITRVSTQFLKPSDGDEKTALNSIYFLFDLTRKIAKSNGRYAINFTKIAVIVLNQIIRPFTAKWHKLSLEGNLETVDGKKEFRKELNELQIELRKYTKLLADLAGVEDITDINEV